MTDFLLRCISKEKDLTSTKARSAAGILSGVVGLICNLLLFAGKLTVGVLSGSVSITADAMNNLSDATSSIVTFIGFKLAEQPADEKHPYGHARFEYLSGLAVAAIIVIIGFELGKGSVEKIFHPAVTTFSVIMLPVLLGSVAVKLWLYLFNRRLGRRFGSQALLATAADSRNDCISTLAVLLAALLEHLTGFVLDGYIGLAVSLFILISGAKLAKETISPLLGENASPELQELIVDYIGSHPKVLGYHDLIVHDYGPGQRFASIHVEMDRCEDPLVCHELIDDMERECLQSHNIHLVIHFDPVITDDPELDRIHARVDEVLRQFDGRLMTHDFRMVKGDGHTNLIFDIALPAALHKQQSDIQAYLDEMLAQEPQKYYTVITFDLHYAAGLQSE